jgi:disulfide oxidoreductase YuzD
MSEPILVQIIGAPIACKEGVKDTWREIAEWASGQLHQRFGEGVQVQYFDLFEPACPPMPPEAQLPLVLVNGEVLSSGGKISVPMIRGKIEAILKKEIA